MTRSAEPTPLAIALNATRLRGQAIGEHDGEDLDHPPVATVGLGDFAPRGRALSAQRPIVWTAGR